MAIPTFMPLVPLLGAVVTFVVFSLLMYACIRNIDKQKKESASDDWWNDEENGEGSRVGSSSS